MHGLQRAYAPALPIRCTVVLPSVFPVMLFVLQAAELPAAHCFLLLICLLFNKVKAKIKELQSRP